MFTSRVGHVYNLPSIKGGEDSVELNVVDFGWYSCGLMLLEVATQKVLNVPR